MKKKLLLVISLLAMLFATAALPVDNGDFYFDGVEEKPLELSEPLWNFSLNLYLSPKKGTGTVYLKHPPRKAEGGYLIALDDLQSIVGKDTVTYDEKEKILSVNKINRVQMGLNRPVYIKQSERRGITIYPTYCGRILYVPLRFLLEELGYTVNFSSTEGNALIIPPASKEKIVPLRQIEVDSLSPYVDGNMATKLLDVSGEDIMGWGEKVPGGMGSFFSVLNNGQLQYRNDLSLEEPRDYDEETKTAVAMDKFALYRYNMGRGSVEKYTIPYSMRKASDVKLDGENFYFKTPQGIYRYDAEKKNLSRVLHRAVESYSVSSGRLAYEIDGFLSVQEDDGGWLLPDGDVRDYILSGSYLVVDDGDMGIVKVYDLNSRKIAYTLAYDLSKNRSLRLVSDRYIAIGQGNKVQLLDLNSGNLRLLDMMNIEPTIRERHIDWLWNGNSLKGYVYAEGKKIAQCITVHP